MAAENRDYLDGIEYFGAMLTALRKGEEYTDDIEEFAKDLHNVKEGGLIRLYCDGSNTLFNNSRVIAAIQEAKYGKDSRVMAISGQDILTDETGFSGLAHLEKNRTIELYRHATFKPKKTLVLTETPEGLLLTMVGRVSGIFPPQYAELVTGEFDTLVDKILASQTVPLRE